MANINNKGDEKEEKKAPAATKPKAAPAAAAAPAGYVRSLISNRSSHPHGCTCMYVCIKIVVQVPTLRQQLYSSN
jgi:hypothetical protein